MRFIILIVIISYILPGVKAQAFSNERGVDVTVTHNLYANGQLGKIELTVDGSDPPYMYKWTGPDGFRSTLQNISGLSCGLYFVTVTSGHGCQAQGDFLVELYHCLNAIQDEDEQGVDCGGLDCNPCQAFHAGLHNGILEEALTSLPFDSVKLNSNRQTHLSDEMQVDSILWLVAANRQLTESLRWKLMNILSRSTPSNKVESITYWKMVKALSYSLSDPQVFEFFLDHLFEIVANFKVRAYDDDPVAYEDMPYFTLLMDNRGWYQFDQLVKYLESSRTNDQLHSAYMVISQILQAPVTQEFLNLYKKQGNGIFRSNIDRIIELEQVPGKSNR